MIKKIRIEQIRKGVYVCDFNCGWQSGSMFTEQALVRDTRIIDILRSWNITEVYIDTAKGLDVEEAQPEPEVREAAHAALRHIGSQAPAVREPVPLREEIRAAREIKDAAMGIINRAFASAREGKAIETEDALLLVRKMEESVARNKDALLLLTRIRNKDEYTMMHSLSVGALILNFCNMEKIGHETALRLAIAALFHDIGKTRIPLHILNKPDRLREEEFLIMKRHTQYAGEVLAGVRDLPAEAFDMALHHHERYDGTGYPHGLQGEGISFASQLAAIVDVYDAITSDRCYRNGIDKIMALRKMYEWSEAHFNRELTYKFIRSIGVYPLGTLVRLESGLIGVVVGSTENMVRPVVRVFHDSRQARPVKTRDLDLSRLEDGIAGYEDRQQWPQLPQDLFADTPDGVFPF
jgi:HD-GYP domain-containing protein (c-di-GMP phosphodiesterase class II)